MKKSRCFKFIPSFLLMFSLLCVFLSSSLLTFNQHSLHSRSQTSPVSAFTIRDNNFFARYINGNIRRNGIKLCHWNKGPGFLSSKLNEIENLIMDTTHTFWAFRKETLNEIMIFKIFTLKTTMFILQNRSTIQI